MDPIVACSSSSSSSSQQELVSTLMSNNEKAREHALTLVAEVDRLRKRETEITRRIQALLEKKQPEQLPEEKAFLEWLLLFRLEADEPSRKPVVTKMSSTAVAGSQQAEAEADSRQTAYSYQSEAQSSSAKDSSSSASSLDKIMRLKEELRLLSRLKKRDQCSWLDQDNREKCTEDSIVKWEACHFFKLPYELRVLYQLIGGRNKFGASDRAVQSHAYSPFLALISLQRIGFTEVWGGDEDPPNDDYLDDSSVQDLFYELEVGHELDDGFICDQLCGRQTKKEKERDNAPEWGSEKRVRALLIGAPLELVSRKGKRTSSRMLLNIRPKWKPDCVGFDTNPEFVGDGLLYRLDSIGDEGDSNLVKVGTAFDWLEQSFMSEVEDRIKSGDPGGLIAKRYPSILASFNSAANNKRQKQQEDESDEDDEEDNEHRDEEEEEEEEEA